MNHCESVAEIFTISVSVREEVTVVLKRLLSFLVK